MEKQRIVAAAYLLILFVAFIDNLLYIAAPVLAYYGFENANAIIFSFFESGCHQLPERSFFLFGKPLTLCARCTGIHLGFLGAVLLYPLARKIGKNKFPPIWLFPVALVPIGLDGLTQFIGLRESANILRLLTGSLFGATLAFFIVPLFIEAVVFIWPLFGELSKDLKRRKPNIYKKFRRL